jgi:N-formylglutamate amidohydrolase
MMPQNDRKNESPGRDGDDLAKASAREGGDKPAFTLSLPEKPPIPVLLAVPHAGRVYPAELSARMRQPKLARLRLEDRFVDLLAEEVARQTGAGLLIAHAPRAMIDLNRTPDDMDWEMVAGGAPRHAARLTAGSRAHSGLGLVPRRLAGMGELWQRRMTQDELEARLSQVHRPYHAALGQALERLRDGWGAALLIDLHSMPPLGRKHGADAAPDFVVGDRFGASCASGLSAAALQHFADVGRLAAHNRPYAGGYVLDRHGAPGRGIHALQIEVCRTTYLDARLSVPAPTLPAVARVLARLVRRLAGDLAGERRMAEAAE